MGLIDVLDKLSTDGVRVQVAFDDRTIIRFLLFGCAAAIVAGALTTLIRKHLSA